MVETLVATIVGSFLFPTLKAGVETAAGKVGEQLGDAAGTQFSDVHKRLWERIRSAFRDDEEADQAMDLLKADPDRYRERAEQILRSRLTEDPGLAAELEAIVQDRSAATDMTGAQIADSTHFGFVDARGVDLRHSKDARIIGANNISSPGA